MSEQVFTARILEDDGSQIVVLPEGLRLPGAEVQVKRRGKGLLLEPIRPKMSREEIAAVFAELDRLAKLHGDFMPEGREQPPMPPDDDIDDIE